MEIFVLEDSFPEGSEEFESHAWLRLPKAATTQIKVGTKGARTWIKRGHLAKLPQPPNVA